MKKFLILGALPLLASCVTIEEARMEKLSAMDQAIYVYGPACVRLGYEADSNDWKKCIVDLDYKDRNSYNYYSYQPYYYYTWPTSYCYVGAYGRHYCHPRRYYR